MSTLYLDTSALGRVLAHEPDAKMIERTVARFDQQVSSRLLRLELHRLALRHGRLAAVDRLLSGISLIPISDELLTLAETLEPARVATLDAVHLATAVRLASGARLDALMTYDKQLAAGARHHGLKVLSPA